MIFPLIDVSCRTCAHGKSGLKCDIGRTSDMDRHYFCPRWSIGDSALEEALDELAKGNSLDREAIVRKEGKWFIKIDKPVVKVPVVKKKRKPRPVYDREEIKKRIDTDFGITLGEARFYYHYRKTDDPKRNCLTCGLCHRDMPNLRTLKDDNRCEHCSGYENSGRGTMAGWTLIPRPFNGALVDSHHVCDLFWQASKSTSGK